MLQRGAVVVVPGGTALGFPAAAPARSRANRPPGVWIALAPTDGGAAGSGAFRAHPAPPIITVAASTAAAADRPTRQLPLVLLFITESLPGGAAGPPDTAPPRIRHLASILRAVGEVGVTAQVRIAR